MSEAVLPELPGSWDDPAETYRAAGRAATTIASNVGVAFRAAALAEAADVASARSQFLGEYTGLVDDTRARLTAVAARTGLARLHALTSAPPEDPSARSGVEVAELRGRAESEDALEQAQSRAGELAAGHGAGMGGLAPMQAMAMMSRVFAGGVHRPGHYDIPNEAPADLDLRLREICSAVTGSARSWVRLAVASVADEEGKTWRLIGTTELDGYLRPGVELRPGEIAAGNEAWPELSIASYCAARGFTPGPLVGALEPPGDVSDHLRDLGFTATWSPDAWAAGWEDSDAPLY